MKITNETSNEGSQSVVVDAEASKGNIVGTADDGISVNQTYLMKMSTGIMHPAKILERRSIKLKRPDSNIAEEPQCYVHYVGTNRRLDEWVSDNRVDISIDQKDVTEMVAEITANGADGDHINRGAERTRLQKRHHKELNNDDDAHHSNIDVEETEATTVAATGGENASYASREKREIKFIEKLRLGKYEMDTWYYSAYPQEYERVSTMYVCQYCLQYMRLKSTFNAHQKECKQRGPPGREIYRKGLVSVFEVDGHQHKLYCQQLCLMSKMFLDDKVLTYTVDVFNFYVMCIINKTGYQIVGYFSKEKELGSLNNVACILVFPPFQRRGYGKFLISFSYELSRREGLISGPEKPLSDIGRASYRSYWTVTLLQLLHQWFEEGNIHNISIQELSEISGIQECDILCTLQWLGMVKYWKGKHVVCATQNSLTKCLDKVNDKQNQRLLVDPNYLRWRAARRAPATAC